MSSMVCNNCFNEGHFYKDCNEPLMSYGLCCYKKINEEYHFLMVLRKNTFTYIEFIRGLYDILDYDYLKNLFNKMSNEEKENMLKYDFKKLWCDIWLIDHDNYYKIKNKTEFYKGIIKFNILKNGFFHNDKNYNIKHFIDISKNSYNDAEWYFPKGKRNINEDVITTSIREFIEETNIKKEDISVYNDIQFDETHIGSNGKNYKTIFFLAEYINNDHDEFINNFKNGYKNSFQKLEIGDIKWISLTELKTYFRNYENTKKELINLLIKYFN